MRITDDCHDFADDGVAMFGRLSLTSREAYAIIYQSACASRPSRASHTAPAGARHEMLPDAALMIWQDFADFSLRRGSLLYGRLRHHRADGGEVMLF